MYKYIYISLSLSFSLFLQVHLQAAVGEREAAESAARRGEKQR
jgi:hypothetical protein